jgi:hypothetical protein
MGRSGLKPRLAVLRLLLSRLSPKRSHPTHVLDLPWKTRSMHLPKTGGDGVGGVAEFFPHGNTPSVV